MGDQHLSRGPRWRGHASELLRQSDLHAPRVFWQENEAEYVEDIYSRARRWEDRIAADQPIAFKSPPFAITEKGWGEFDMSITLVPIGSPKGGDQLIQHDLNFQQERYESTHSVTFRNPKGELLEALRQSGSVGDAGTTNGASGAAKPEKKRQKQNRNVDMEKLAEALPQLAEDDLLQVVQMVHDNKSEETYTKNDVESK